MFSKSKSSKAPSTISPPSSSSPSTDRIRSRQPFSAVPLEQRKQRPSHVPLDALLEVYDDYPLLVKDYENQSERLRLVEKDSDEANTKREETQALLDQERHGRAEDANIAKVTKAQAEKDVEKRVRGELDPKIAELEKKLREMTKDRDEIKAELKYRTNKLESWTGDLARLHGETNSQMEREIKAAEDRRLVLEKSKKLHMEILSGLRDISERPEHLVSTSSNKAASTKAASTFGEKKTARSVVDSPTTPFGAEKKKRNYDLADGDHTRD